MRPVSITHRDHFVNVAKRRALEANEAQNNATVQINAHVSQNEPSNGTSRSNSRGGYFADQFENLANYRAHYEWTGPEIWNQTKGKIHAFVAASGTGGTIAGISQLLKVVFSCVVIKRRGDTLVGQMIILSVINSLWIRVSFSLRSFWSKSSGFQVSQLVV